MKIHHEGHEVYEEANNVILRRVTLVPKLQFGNQMECEMLFFAKVMVHNHLLQWEKEGMMGNFNAKPRATIDSLPCVADLLVFIGLCTGKGKMFRV